MDFIKRILARIFKRTCHITIEVESVETPKKGRNR